MTTIRFTSRGLLGGYTVRFGYDPDLVALIKQTPRWDRDWDPELRIWTLHSDEAARAFALAARAQGHQVTGLNQERVAPPPPSREPVAWADALFSAVGPTRSEAVFRALVRVLHPDSSTGDTALMQQLNAARERVSA